MHPQRFIQTGMDITLCHHEKWDGSGYPNGLKGKKSPFCADYALADVYDALRSKRVYKEGFSHEKSVEIIHQIPASILIPFGGAVFTASPGVPHL